jgi:ATP-dependent helicase/nuclease subunit A
MSQRADGLNDDQAAAARHLAGRLLIDAGAGSGKTRTLTQRILYALTPGAVERWEPAGVDEILAITFTEKAAGEIGERVRRSLRQAGRIDDARRLDAAWFSTIHGMCARLLRRHALEAGVDPAFTVLDAVTAFRMKERAFAEAASAAMTASDAGQALLGTYGYEAVATAVERLRRELHSRGLTSGSLALEPAPDAVPLWRDAVAFFERMRVGWDACPSATSTAEKQRDGCELTLSALERVPADSLPPHLLASEVWDILDAHPQPPARDLKGAEELLADMRPERERLLAAAACAASAPLASALRLLVGDFARRYGAAKAAVGGLDFDDLQIEALRLLETCPDVAECYRDQFRLVMVDEFQDTDSLQLRLVQALSRENLCTVGDERQSIYRFRGADVDVYRDHVLAMERKDALRVSLAANYRSHAEVLAFVNDAFGTPVLFGESLIELRAERDESSRPRCFGDEARVELVTVRRERNRSTVTKEAEVVADRFALLREAGIPPGAMAVLLRTYKHADEFAASLRARGLPALVVGGSRFFELPEVCALRALCRTLANPSDDEAIALLLASAFAELSDDGLWLLRNDPASGGRRVPLFDGLLAASGLPPDDAEAASRAMGVLERSRARIGRMRLSEILLRAVEESAWDLRLLAEADAGRQAYANVLKFARMADAFESVGGAGPAAFVEYLDAKEESGDGEAPATLTDDASPSVRIMSIHASKGLEFAVVALPQLGDGPRGERGALRWRAEGDGVAVALALPSSRCSSERSKTNVTPWFAAFDEVDETAEEEEAKRLFYVACTRAEEKLFLLGGVNMKDEASSRSPLDWLGEASAYLRAEGRTLRIARESVDLESEKSGSAEPDESAAGLEASPDETPAALLPAAPTEPAAGVPPIPDRLSYSDIALYRRCPLRFHAEKVLRVGCLSAPATSGDKRAFGSAVHAALQLAVDGEPPDATRYAALARLHGLEAIDVRRLREVVESFLDSALAREIGRMEVVRTEAPFVVPVGDGPTFLLRGSIDCYARTGDEGLIADYKTGTDGDEATLPERFGLQASCYAFVALRDGCERVRVVFARPEMPSGEGSEAIRYDFTLADAEGIAATLTAEHERMAAGEYAPLPAWRREVCGECPVAGSICPVAPPMPRSAV